MEQRYHLQLRRSSQAQQRMLWISYTEKGGRRQLINRLPWLTSLITGVTAFPPIARVSPSAREFITPLTASAIVAPPPPPHPCLHPNEIVKQYVRPDPLRGVVGIFLWSCSAGLFTVTTHSREGWDLITAL